MDKQDQTVSAPSAEVKSPATLFPPDGQNENQITYEEVAEYNWWVVHYALRIAAPSRALVDMDKLPLLRINGVRPMATMPNPLRVGVSNLSEPQQSHVHNEDNLPEPVLSW